MITNFTFIEIGLIEFMCKKKPYLKSKVFCIIHLAI